MHGEIRNWVEKIPGGGDGLKARAWGWRMTEERVGGFDPGPYKAWGERRERRREEALDARVSAARGFLPYLRDEFLRIDPDIRSIVLFGSLARGRPRRVDFDIDIAVRSERYLELVAWALRQEWKIDVVDLESVGEAVLAGIESYGESLYER